MRSEFGESVNAKLLVPGGEAKLLNLKWPTDEQWIRRQRARKVLIKDLGRGASETSVEGGEDVDLDLVRALSSTDLNGITPGQATTLLNQLSNVSVQDVRREDSHFVVEMRACGGVIMEIKLNCPSADQAIKYRRYYIRMIDLPYNKQEVKTNLQVAADLFNDLAVDPADKMDLAIIHKTAAVQAVVSELDRLLEPSSESEAGGSARP